MAHVLTIDWECWPQMVLGEITGRARPIGREGLERSTDRLLEVLARHRVTATVFLLGVSAEAFPDLAARIASAGHEIASHGYHHRPAFWLSPEGLARDLKAARAVIAEATGRTPDGFRAPYFSIRRRNLWALETIAQAGFAWDSSIFPILHRRYGIAGWPRGPSLVAGGRLVELPLATLEVGPLRLPIAGGGYFRALPQRVILDGLDHLARAGQSAVLYLHPYQLDVAPPPHLPGPLSTRGRVRAEAFRLAQSLGRGRGFELLDALLPRFEWITAGALRSRFLTLSGARPMHAA